MNRIIEPMRKLWIGLAAALVLGGFLVTPAARSDKPIVAAPAPVFLLTDGQETHGKHGRSLNSNATILLADGQETHGKKPT